MLSHLICFTSSSTAYDWFTLKGGLIFVMMTFTISTQSLPHPLGLSSSTITFKLNFSPSSYWNRFSKLFPFFKSSIFIVCLSIVLSTKKLPFRTLISRWSFDTFFATQSSIANEQWGSSLVILLIYCKVVSSSISLTEKYHLPRFLNLSGNCKSTFRV